MLKADGRTACLAARHSPIVPIVAPPQAQGEATAFQGTLAFPWQFANYIDHRRWPACRGRVGMVRTQRIALAIGHRPTIATAALAPSRAEIAPLRLIGRPFGKAMQRIGVQHRIFADAEQGAVIESILVLGF